MGSRRTDSFSERKQCLSLLFRPSQILPSLFGKNWAGYPVRRINFAVSVALHGVMAFLMGAGFLMVKSFVPQVERQTIVTVRLEPYPVPIGSHPGQAAEAAEQWKKFRPAKAWRRKRHVNNLLRRLFCIIMKAEVGRGNHRDCAS